LVYFALILVLFTITTFGWRGAEALGKPAPWTVSAQAQQLGLREQDRGEVELGGSFIRLALTGSRGLVVCGGWMYLTEAQKKNQWSEVEVAVQNLTKLQPHYIQPWLFQTWNLAYNVSVECDRIRDKYYFMTRGIQVLAEGERQNRNNPDMRFAIGFYYQHKICQSDESNTLRSLFQMSCTDPIKRNPALLRRPDGQVYLDRFEHFCKHHPHLVRRLREKLGLNTPEEIVRFLDENQRVPSLYRERKDTDIGGEGSPLRPPAERFPVLPPPLHSADRRMPEPQRPYDPNELTYDDVARFGVEKLGDDSFDAYAVSRAWYAYAQEPLPDPDKLPGRSKPITNRLSQRLNRQMATCIFRTYPPRAQSFVAEWLEKEGWFDQGWEISDWFKDAEGNDRPVVVGNSKWAAEAWKKAHEMWLRTGQENGLLLTKEQEQELEELAAQFRQATGLRNDDAPPQFRDPLPPGLQKGYDAFAFLYWNRYYAGHGKLRGLTNFRHHYNRALVYLREDGITARRHFFEADQLRREQKQSKFHAALEKYEDPKALPTWKALLTQFRDFSRDDDIQEEAYDIQWRYLNLFHETRDRGPRLKLLLGLEAYLAQAAGGPVVTPDWWSLALLSKERARLVPNPQIQGPFDDVDDDGQPLISKEVRAMVHQRRNVAAGRPPQAGQTTERTAPKADQPKGP
jgi:hypothetical protein